MFTPKLMTGSGLIVQVTEDEHSHPAQQGRSGGDLTLKSSRECSP